MENGILVPVWTAGVAGSVFLMLTGIIAYFVKRIVDDLSSAKEKLDKLVVHLAEDFATKGELGALRSDLVGSKAEIHRRLDDMVGRMGEVEVRCAGMHGVATNNQKTRK